MTWSSEGEEISSWTEAEDASVASSSSKQRLLCWQRQEDSFTLAEDLMPLIIANETMAQAANRQPVMTGFISPDSSMEFVMLRAFRNQKYEVGDELEHSFTVRRKKMERFH